MKQKSLTDIYKRNFKGTFFGGFTIAAEAIEAGAYLFEVLVPVIPHPIN